LGLRKVTNAKVAEGHGRYGSACAWRGTFGLSEANRAMTHQ
jgi:hypothetical protein